MANEENGFKVVDRRSSARQQEKAPEGPTGAKPPAEPQAADAVKGPGWEMREERADKPLPPIDFSTFCLSLASSAMMHLGVVPYPDSGQTERNLPLAKQTIDILVMLEEKTRGNLSAEESKLISTVLYDLQMRFVEARGART